MWFFLITAAFGLGAGLIWFSRFRYVALGDSLAAGVGSFTFYGYVPRLSVRLAPRLRRLVVYDNLGRFGMTSGQLLDALQSDENFRKAVRRARLITVDIGGNDLRHCNHQGDCLDEALVRYRENWKALLTEIRLLNPNAPLAAMTLYNPYPQGDVRRPGVDAVIRQLNAITADPKLVNLYEVAGVARVYEAFLDHECEYTWFCRVGDIHPTDQGYDAMTDALMAVLQLGRRKLMNQILKEKGRSEAKGD